MPSFVLKNQLMFFSFITALSHLRSNIMAAAATITKAKFMTKK
jgi:hypothetical protein